MLEGAERSKLALSFDDVFDGGGAERADQLVLQVHDAHEETECFHVGASEVRAEARTLETAPERALLSDVAETGQSDVAPVWAEEIQEVADARRTPDGHDGNSLGVKIPTPAPSERFERDLVADSFNQYDRA
jgi:hypothetical protein